MGDYYINGVLQPPTNSVVTPTSSPTVGTGGINSNPISAVAPFDVESFFAKLQEQWKTQMDAQTKLQQTQTLNQNNLLNKAVRTNPNVAVGQTTNELTGSQIKTNPTGQQGAIGRYLTDMWSK